MTGKKTYKDVYQEYVLRKDKNGQWKILAWDNTSDESKKEQESKEK